MVCLKFVCEIAMPAANAPIIPAIPRISAKYTKAKQMTREMDTTGSVTFNLDNNFSFLGTRKPPASKIPIKKMTFLPIRSPMELISNPKKTSHDS